MNNTAGLHGGAFYVGVSTTVVFNGTNVFTSNCASTGGVMYTLVSTIELNGISNFTRNEVSLDGSDGASMSVYSSVIHIRGQALFSRNVANGTVVFLGSSNMTVDGHVDFEYNHNGVMWLWESNLTTFGEISFSNNEFKELPPVAFRGTIESYFSNISFSGQTNYINNTITNELGYGRCPCPPPPRL